MGTRALIKIDFDGGKNRLTYFRGMDGHPINVIPYLLGAVLPETPLNSAAQLLSLQDKLNELAEQIKYEKIDEGMCDYVYSVTIDSDKLQLHYRRFSEEEKLVYAEIYQSINGEIWKRVICSNGFD
ncbi:hypothetical protein [Desulfonema limicola]|nr:hypothetical protein [Desulfonema limicola]